MDTPHWSSKEAFELGLLRSLSYISQMPANTVELVLANLPTEDYHSEQEKQAAFRVINTWICLCIGTSESYWKAVLSNDHREYARWLQLYEMAKSVVPT